MKKIITILMVCMFSVLLAFSVNADDGKVFYDGNAKRFIFEPGSEYSPTDLFPDFKDVMPGDTLTQKITFKNKADNNAKVKVYIRSLGAHEDSVEFLSKLGLSVKKSDDNKMAYMFDAAAHETAQLSDWVCLGTLYSGGEVNLDLKLSVPPELNNDFQNKTGFLDWEFRIEEFPIEKDDPKPPQTGDSSNVIVWIIVMLCSLGALFILFVWLKKEKKNK
ncbi:MAG: LPXTG cell wall anchor domain-containing protein [Clostridia bacterium]|nr:LPXTG cell wall anchor domain-containing protein [Clostridia bacterium]